MSDIDVLWLNFNPEAPHYGYWCYGWLEETFQLDGPAEWSHDTFHHHKTVGSLGENKGAVVIIPAEYNGEHIEKINDTLNSMPWAVVILASDEQGLFPVEKLTTRITSLWVMTPHFEKHEFPDGTNYLGEFYPQTARSAIGHADWPKSRPYAAGFSGQITHQRREELKRSMLSMISVRDDVFFNGTGGFTQGLNITEYYQHLVNNKVTPAPSGPVTLDSFRAFESLEAGSVPVLDLNCPVTQNGARYWNAVFGPGHPLPTVSHWDELPEIVDLIQEPADTNMIFAWWQVYKRNTRKRILADVPGYDPGKVTALVPTSPISSHPSTEIIEETIESIQRQHPTAEIIIMIDGVRSEQEHYQDQYQEYIQNLLRLCNFKWRNVVPLLFTEHRHQAGMTRDALDLVDTPHILFVEHDTPLVSDRQFDWDEMYGLIEGNILDMIRFHYAGHIHPEHEYLMTDPIPVNLDGLWVRRTVQWSQRPHIAGADYYRHILNLYFAADSVTMIEDRMHSMARTYPEANRLAVYCPPDDDGSIIRSYHLDGRKTDPKYAMNFGSVTE